MGAVGAKSGWLEPRETESFEPGRVMIIHTSQRFLSGEELEDKPGIWRRTQRFSFSQPGAWMPPLQEVSRGFQSVRLAELHTAVQSSSLGSGFEGHAFRCIRGYGAFMQGRWPVELVGVQAGQFRPWPVSYEASITSGQLQSGYLGWCAAQASTRKNHSSFSVPSGTVPTFHPPPFAFCPLHPLLSFSNILGAHFLGCLLGLPFQSLCLTTEGGSMWGRTDSTRPPLWTKGFPVRRQDL